MDHLPNDLVPLPTMPYNERPSSMPLDREECRTAIWECRGNITEAAKMLKITSRRLRKFVSDSPYLTAECQEAQEQLVDMAEDVVFDALTDINDNSRRDQMARYVLTNLGKDRGYSGGKGSVNINAPKGNINVFWGDGSSLSGPEVIEGEVVDQKL